MTFLAALVTGACVLTGELRADHIIMKLGEDEFVIEGRASNLDQAYISVTHEKFKKTQLYLPYRRPGLLSVTEVIKVPTRKEQYNKRLAKAQKGNEADRMDLAVWAIKHGMVDEFHRAIELVLEAEPKHQQARKVQELRAVLAEPLPESPEEEKPLRDLLGSAGIWKYKRSPHYILAYDTPEDRAQERLDLLERVYETFFMFFTLKGCELQKPAERMMVVLFNEYKNYYDFSVRLDPDLKSAAGYWSPETNIAVFFAHGKDPRFERLTELTEDLNKRKKEAERTKDRERGDLVRFADTVDLLRKVALESQDIEVVTHEGTHQIAGNNGLFPRRVRIPRWVQEGMAAYFESPKDAAWSGIGAVNELRLEWYRALEKDRVHSDIDFIASDQVYSRAASHGAVLHAYGQAWALTHYLMEDRFGELTAYWRNLARLPADMVISEHTVTECFDAAFGKDRTILDQEWRRHMNGLQTDTDKLRKEYGDKLRG